MVGARTHVTQQDALPTHVTDLAIVVVFGLTKHNESSRVLNTQQEKLPRSVRTLHLRRVLSSCVSWALSPRLAPAPCCPFSPQQADSSPAKHQQDVKTAISKHRISKTRDLHRKHKRIYTRERHCHYNNEGSGGIEAASGWQAPKGTTRHSNGFFQQLTGAPRFSDARHRVALTQWGQCQLPSGASSSSGSRHTRWYARGHETHRSSSPDCLQL